MLSVVEVFLEIINDSGKGGFSKYVGICSAILAEFWGVLKVLKIAQFLGYSKI